ncbi:MAG: hypothetical protein H6658_01615 [Ardenticatenaceae bacterium]|nr:hypothetical protein [Ardenticatenaceae bacterium]
MRKMNMLWGIGLVSVTTAVLLDTFLGVFNREQMLADLGFFFYVIAGALFAGTAVWLWGLLRPITTITTTDATAVPPPAPPTPPREASGTAFDRQMLYDQIRTRFGREDILDLIFDLSINESEVMTIDQDLQQLIVKTMDWAEQHGETAALALAVERILTPLPPENLPRLEKITADSPPTVLRQYLLAHYTLAQLHQMADRLGLDWEQLGSGSKKEKVRSLLLYLIRRSRLPELVELMKSLTAVTN